MVPGRPQSGGVARLVVDALVRSGVLHGHGLHPLLSQGVGELDVAGNVVLAAVAAVAPGREGVTDRREPLGVGAEVQEDRDERGADAVVAQARDDLTPPGGVLGLGLERGYHEASVGQPVCGRGRGKPGQLVGEGARVGVQGGHVRHQHDPEARIDALRRAQQHVDALPVDAGQGKDVDSESVEAGVPGSPHLPLQIGELPVAAGPLHGQRPVTQQSAVGRVLALLALRREVVAGVVVVLGGLVVEGERIRRKVVREDQMRSVAEHIGSRQVERKRLDARSLGAGRGVFPVTGQPGAGDQSDQ